MNTRRPTIGNTVALDRFTEAGPSGYAAVYDDGTHGPARTTREEAEADYRIYRDARAGSGSPAPSLYSAFTDMQKWFTM